MKTLTIRGHDGKALQEVPYHGIYIKVGEQPVKLGLCHYLGSWQVADPVSGAKVMTVYGLCRGISCGSGSYGPRQATALARGQLEALINQVGEEKFLAVLNAKREGLKNEVA